MSLLKGRYRYLIAIPLFSAFFWFSALLAMLLTWLISGRPIYATGQPFLPYISDIGATFLKPLFVIACCIAGVGLLLSLAIERLLRNKGRLHPEHRRRERVFGQLAIGGGFIAMWGLALLSEFDTRRYPTAHMIFLIVFIAGVGLSAIFTVAEFRWLSHDYADVEKLRRAYVAKAVIGLSLVALSVVFGVTFFYAPNVATVVEWTIAFGFTFYLLTFAYDLRLTTSGGAGGSGEGMVEVS